MQERSTDPGKNAAFVDPARDRAVRLFRYLREVVARRQRPVTDVDSYERTIWLAEVPDAQTGVWSALEAGEPDPTSWLTVDRPPYDPPPDPPAALAGRLSATSDPEAEPALVEAEPPADTRLAGPDDPLIHRAYHEYLARWRTWAEQERRRRPVRDLYDTLFQVSQWLERVGEDFELIIGAGCLAWRPENATTIRRHLLVQQARVDLDERTARLTVSVDDDSAPQLELDMLPAAAEPSAATVNRLRREADELSRLLDTQSVTEQLIRWSANLHSRCRFLESPERPRAEADPVIAYAPALILRKRREYGMVRLLEGIADELKDGTDVPAGVRLLVEPTSPPDTAGEGQDVDRFLLPLPANDEQREVVERITRSDHVVVQGPPGTGKTTIIANLVAHLLARGKRVLVTAEADRALKELRGKLPAELASMCVSVVGRDRSELQKLANAVRGLTSRREGFNRDRAQQRISECEQSLERLERERAAKIKQIIELRTRETQVTEHGPYRGSRMAIARQLEQQAEQLGWLDALGDVLPGGPPPLSNDDVHELIALSSVAASEDADSARRRLPDLSGLPAPAAFAELVERERRAREASDGSPDAAVDRLLLGTRSAGERQDLLRNADELERLRQQFDSLRDWVDQARTDLTQGRRAIWQQRSEKTRRVIEVVTGFGHHLQRRVVAHPTHLNADYLHQAAELAVHLESGGKFVTGILAPRAVRRAADLLANVRVDGRRPDTADRCRAVIVAVELEQILDRAETLWSDAAQPPPDRAPLVRLAWLRDELQVLDSLLSWDDNARRAHDAFPIGAPTTSAWRDPGFSERLRHAVQRLEGRGQLDRLQQRLRHLEASLDAFRHASDAPPEARELARAVDARDPGDYGRAHERLQHLTTTAAQLRRRDELVKRLGYASGVLDLLTASSEAERSRYADTFTEAWWWAQARRWLREDRPAEPERLGQELDSVDRRIRKRTTELTARLAELHAVQRLGPEEQHALAEYALAIRQEGKGTGTHAARRRRIARQALGRCRGAVPAWIMPLYRIAESVEVGRDVFDVAIIDEASQAGPEASVLHYLAPKVVVVGDDKQMSPAGVGVDQTMLTQLGGQYLAGIPADWTYTDPTISFWDQSKTRFGNVVTLVEHFHCMPEIIAFSQQIAYEPEGIKLKPLRQYGSDRLDPIRTVYVEGGYERGSGTRGRVNRPEAEAVADQIVRCCGDPRYDRLSFGVISLTGSRQASEIERMLLDRVDARELRSRDLRCGDAAAFQGSERDVMFLSMVASPDRRLAPLIGGRYTQRFNVAASRARDQLWLFHSVKTDHLSNKEDMRYRLLEFCQRADRSEPRDESGEVSETEPDDRFDSIFEQRVYNDLRRRGYHVVPQWEALNYRIDLVVVGGTCKLAIECDGDQYHTPEQYERDITRQRELERCGWVFERITGSAYFTDSAGAMEPIWRRLQDLGIRPDVAASAADGASGPDVAASAADGASGRNAADGVTQPDPSRGSAVASEDGESMDASGGEPTAGPALAVSSQPEPLPYREWDTLVSLVDPLTASLSERCEAVMRIVAVEGPIQGDRLYQLFVKSAGGSRVGSQVRGVLNQATQACERRSELIADNPLGEPGQQAKTFRLRGQPKVRLRELGPRSIHEVPPAELAELMSSLRRPDQDEEAWFRTVLETYGLKRLAAPTQARLQQCAKLMVNDLDAPETSAGRIPDRTNEAGAALDPVRTTSTPAARTSPDQQTADGPLRDEPTARPAAAEHRTAEERNRLPPPGFVAERFADLLRLRQRAAATIERLSGQPGSLVQRKRLIDAESQLRDVEDAFVRLKEGTYGTCVSCGGPVASERLKARPAAATCMACVIGGVDGAPRS